MAGSLAIGHTQGRNGGGRKAGTPNKIISDLRAMILESLDYAGGAEYLRKQADENPVAYMGLLAKLLPTTVNSGDVGSPIAMHLLAAQMMSTQLLEQQAQSQPPTLNGHAEAATVVDLNAPPPTE